MRRIPPSTADLQADPDWYDSANIAVLRTTMVLSYLGSCGITLPTPAVRPGPRTGILMSRPSGDDTNLLDCAAWVQRVTMFIDSSSFAHAFDNWMVSILMWISPWMSILLVDYFLVRRRTLSIPDLYRDGATSIYGKFNACGLVSLAAGLLASWSWQYGVVPAMQLPMAKSLGQHRLLLVVGQPGSRPRLRRPDRPGRHSPHRRVNRQSDRGGPDERFRKAADGYSVENAGAGWRCRGDRVGNPPAEFEFADYQAGCHDSGKGKETDTC
ncbi:cytosine permease [Nocardia sp. NPDC052112]|uniref:cytosine permease n=1 Tax=Nocardia sp. NPDC052112 TaxID=3155646 RepID=UPI00343D31E8